MHFLCIGCTKKKKPKPWRREYANTQRNGSQMWRKPGLICNLRLSCTHSIFICTFVHTYPHIILVILIWKMIPLCLVNRQMTKPNRSLRAATRCPVDVLTQNIFRMLDRLWSIESVNGSIVGIPEINYDEIFLKTFGGTIYNQS